MAASLSFFTPEEFGSSTMATPPPADLFVLPALLFLGLPEGRRPRPAFAYGESSSMGLAFASGCVDYLREPWGLEELGARASRLEVLRVMTAAGKLELKGQSLSSGSGSCHLTEDEARILRLLMLNVGHAVPRAAFSAASTGRFEAGTRSLDVHLSAIRRKAASLMPPRGIPLVACRNKGYILEGVTCG